MARSSLFFPVPMPCRAGAALASAEADFSSMERASAVICWTLQGGRAMSFTATLAGALRVSRGRIWLTFSHAGRIDRHGQVTTPRLLPGHAGDLMLRTGQSVLLAAGDWVVFEPFAIAGTTDAALQWRSLAGAS